MSKMSSICGTQPTILTMCNGILKGGEKEKDKIFEEIMLTMSISN